MSPSPSCEVLSKDSGGDAFSIDEEADMTEQLTVLVHLFFSMCTNDSSRKYMNDSSATIDEKKA